MNVVAWNVRGYNDPSKSQEVKELFKKHNIHVLYLIEIRVKEHKNGKIRNKLSRCWQ